MSAGWIDTTCPACPIVDVFRLDVESPSLLDRFAERLAVHGDAITRHKGPAAADRRFGIDVGISGQMLSLAVEE